MVMTNTASVLHDYGSIAFEHVFVDITNPQVPVDFIQPVVWHTFLR